MKHYVTQHDTRPFVCKGKHFSVTIRQERTRLLSMRFYTRSWERGVDASCRDGACVCVTLSVRACKCIELLFTNLIPRDTSHLVQFEKVSSGLFSCSSSFLLKALTDYLSQGFTKSVSCDVWVFLYLYRLLIYFLQCVITGKLPARPNIKKWTSKHRNIGEFW